MLATIFRSSDSACRSRARLPANYPSFATDTNDKHDGLWLALDHGVVEGAIAIDGSHADQDGAHLRWFITSEAIRGQGVGTTLLTAAIQFCYSAKYDRVYLWTFEGLSAARHLYEKFGFRLSFQQRGTQWGTEVNEQRFDLSVA